MSDGESVSSVTARVDARELQKALRVAPDMVKRSAHNLLERGGIMTQGIMRTKVKTGVSGELKKSIRYYFRDYLTIVIEPTARHAAAHEYGSKPHWTSVRNLERWAKMKGISPYALQRSIAKKGTKAHPYLQSTLREVDSRVLPDFTGGMSRTIGQILTR